MQYVNHPHFASFPERYFNTIWPSTSACILYPNIISSKNKRHRSEIKSNIHKWTKKQPWIIILLRYLTLNLFDTEFYPDTPMCYLKFWYHLDIAFSITHHHIGRHIPKSYTEDHKLRNHWSVYFWFKWINFSFAIKRATILNYILWHIDKLINRCQ